MKIKLKNTNRSKKNTKTVSMNSYKTPTVTKLSTTKFNKATRCACKSGDDNPY